ncbi:MAG: asparagine synthase (glutamine-hydrolyzing) [bacterium]|jgi:asparagine synthase (glutamine-hydrolysing)|nr:asparagine synthase (glutamine-hydrolyzing) [Phycisphaerales bacterium]
MCGIAIYCGWVDDVGNAAVNAMCDAMAHRGPDGHGVWRSSPSDRPHPGVIFGHRRLSIIDLTAGSSQPMVDETTGQAVTFNGEIYNFKSLRSRLQRDGHRFRSTGDTEVLLRSGIQHGLQTPTLLRGMFAYGQWDPAARTLVLARDHLGIKPLYWTIAHRPDGRTCFLAASEVRALLATGLVERRVDALGLEAFLFNGFVTGPGTLVHRVQELPPGTISTVTPDRLAPQTRRYWRPPAPDCAVGHDPAAITHALHTSIHTQLVSDVPLGIFLSGGVDSSAIANLAARHGTAAPHTFNISVARGEMDEAPYAERVARDIGAVHTCIRLDPADILRSLPEAMGTIDQPTFDGLNTYFVSRATRRAGVTVALAGTGGDELFGGYHSFQMIQRLQRLAVAPGFLLRALALLASAPHQLMWMLGIAPGQTGAWKLDSALAATPDLLRLYQSMYMLFNRSTLTRLYSRSDLPCGLEKSLRDELLDDIAHRHPLDAVSLLELRLFLGARLLRDTDAASMAASLEVRVPLVDHQIAEAAFSLEPRTRYGRLGEKTLLRSIGLVGLDPQIFNRKKAGFVLPFAQALRVELRPLADQLFADQALLKRVGLNPRAVWMLWIAFLSNRKGVYWTRIWALFSLLWWCREHRMSLHEP